MKALLVLALVSMGCLAYLAYSVDLQSLADSYTSAPPSGSTADLDDGTVTLASSQATLSDASNAKRGAVATSTPKVTLMKFGANWCGPCRMIDKELPLLKREIPALFVRKIDVDRDKSLSQRYNVGGIPHLVLLADGEVIGEKTGYMSSEKLASWIRSRAAANDADAGLVGKARKASQVKMNPFFK